MRFRLLRMNHLCHLETARIVQISLVHCPLRQSPSPDIAMFLDLQQPRWSYPLWLKRSLFLAHQGSSVANTSMSSPVDVSIRFRETLSHLLWKTEALEVLKY